MPYLLMCIAGAVGAIVLLPAYVLAAGLGLPVIDVLVFLYGLACSMMLLRLSLPVAFCRVTRITITATHLEVVQGRWSHRIEWGKVSRIVHNEERGSRTLQFWMNESAYFQPSPLPWFLRLLRTDPLHPERSTLHCRNFELPGLELVDLVRQAYETWLQENMRPSKEWWLK